jgi:hypothetical protein
MQLEELEELWKTDSIISEYDLTKEALKIPQLHSKYYKLYIREKILLLKYKADYKKLKMEKYEFLTNPTEEGFDKGWKLPPQGKILKTELSTFLDGDSDLINTELKLGVQEEKVFFLKSIIDTINTRNFIIKNMIEDRKFMNGG